jgi:hypothetical protein
MAESQPLFLIQTNCLGGNAQPGDILPFRAFAPQVPPPSATPREVADLTGEVIDRLVRLGAITPWN